MGRMNHSRTGSRIWASRLAAASAACLVVLPLATGCSASRCRQRGIDRNKVAQAELMDKRQRVSTLQGQLRDAHAGTDMAQGQVRQLNDDLHAARQAHAAEQAAASQSAAGIAELRARLVQEQTAVASIRGEIQGLDEQMRRIADQRNNNEAARILYQESAPLPHSVPMPDLARGPSPAAQAMQRDLQAKLRDYGVFDLPVEVRQDAGGERVAVVLPDAFNSGKASLASNKSAVKAIVGLATLIRDHYPSAQVLVEGHTDSDPIRRSNWQSNEHLSHARADAVRQLLNEAGVGGSQVHTQGFGAGRPLAGGSSKAEKSRNRRVEIFIAPNA